MTTLTKLEQDIEKLFSKLNESIEMAAAKVIKEINDKIDKCEKSLLEDQHNKQLSLQAKEHISQETSLSGLTKYSYPNFMVGNEELGSSKDPQSMSWPFDHKKET